MIDPKPLRELEGPPAAVRAAADIDAALRDYTWPRDRKAQVWWSLRARAVAARQPARRTLRTVGFAVGGAAALAALAVAVLPSTRQAPTASAVATASPAFSSARAPAPGSTWTRIDMGDLGVLEASPEADVEIREQPTFRELRIENGTLRAEVLHQDPARPVIVTTPHLRVIVVGTRFDVNIEAQRTRVDLLEGAVRVLRSDAAVGLRAGESIESDDARLNPPSPIAAPAPTRPPHAVGGSATSPLGPHRPARPAFTLPLSAPPAAEPPSLAQCEREHALDARERCFAQLAAGDDLAAQTALYTLGMLATDRPGGDARALERAREYQRRFPNGALVAEAAMREIELLMKLDRPEKAVERAVAFETRYAGDPRARDVALARAGALCSIPGRRAEAHALIERFMTDADPTVRSAAITLRSRCRSDERPEELPAGGSPAQWENQAPAD